MPVSRTVSQVSFGGNAVNNPPNYSWTDYSNYPGLDTKKSYVRMNVTYFNSGLGVNLQLTGLVVLNDQGFPLMSANDLVYLPCPPECS
jgi:hypothetical protein